MESIARTSRPASQIPASDASPGIVPPAERPALLDDPRSKRILAKTIYRELRESGVAEKDVLVIATELLGLVADEMRGPRRD